MVAMKLFRSARSKAGEALEKFFGSRAASALINKVCLRVGVNYVLDKGR